MVLTEIEQELKNAYLRSLKIYVISLTYEKLDGSIHTVNATLKEDMIIKRSKKVLPEGVEAKKKKHTPLNSISAFNIDTQKWLSFKLNKVIRLKLKFSIISE